MLTLPQDFNTHIPPWKEASCWGKFVISYFYISLYFPVIIVVFLTTVVYVVYTASYIIPMMADPSHHPPIYYWATKDEH